IGADEEAFRSALAEIPAMSLERFEQVGRLLFLMADQMSNAAHQKTRQTRWGKERKKLEDDSRLNESRLQTLLELNQMTDSTFQEIADFTLAEGVKLTRSKIGCLALVNEEETVLTIHSWFKTSRDGSGMMLDRPEAMEIEELGLLGEAVWQRRPVITNNYKDSSLLIKGYPEDRVGVARFLNIPLVENEKIAALIAVGNKEEAYDFSDITQLTLLMDGMWKIIQRRRSEVELKKHRDHLEEMVKERTRALQESETRFRALIEKSTDIILVIDKEGTFTYASPSVFQFGYRPETIMGEKAPLDHIHPDDLWRAKKFWEISLNRPNETVRLDNIRFRRHDGSHRWLSGLLTCLLDQPGVNGVVMHLRDVTERKQAAEALKKSEERFRDVALSSSDWIWEVDARGKYTYSGGKVLEVIGAAPREVIGKSPFEFMPEKEAEKSREAWREAVSRKAEIHDFENWFVHEDGHLVCLQTSGVPILDKQGKLQGYRGLSKDVTMRVEAREALTRGRDLAELANEFKSDFLKNISHEIRTPMNAIIGLNRLLLETRLDDAQRQYAQMAAKSADSLLTLVNDLFDFSKADAGKMTLEIIDFNIRTTLDGAADVILL
ncbi:MAG: PAS domain S-box protein, partial [Desulfobacterales bacterium]|nr:PAS domain S-box protein [Desulfobacterales bacterium]